MPLNEATARIKINRLLEAAGWRFFPEVSKPANGRIALSSCDRPTCPTCHPDRARAEFGELGYHGQEGYRTRIYDADRFEDLPNASPDHPDFDSHSPGGYESASTGFLQVGARDYDPEIGRWLQPDPLPIGAEATAGVQNRWAYCSNDPVNASDPSGRMPGWAQGIVLAIIGTVLMTIAIFGVGGAATVGAFLLLVAAWLFGLACILKGLGLLDPTKCRDWFTLGDRFTSLSAIAAMLSSSGVARLLGIAGVAYPIDSWFTPLSP